MSLEMSVDLNIFNMYSRYYFYSFSLNHNFSNQAWIIKFAPNTSLTHTHSIITTRQLIVALFSLRFAEQCSYSQRTISEFLPLVCKGHLPTRLLVSQCFSQLKTSVSYWSLLEHLTFDLCKCTLLWSLHTGFLWLMCTLMIRISWRHSVYMLYTVTFWVIQRCVSV